MCRTCGRSDMGSYASKEPDIEYVNISLYSPGNLPETSSMRLDVTPDFVSRIHGSPFTLEHANGKLPSMGLQSRTVEQLHRALEKSGDIVGRIEAPFVAPTGTVMGTVRVNSTGKALLRLAGASRDWLLRQEISLTHFDTHVGSIRSKISVPVEGALTEEAARPGCLVLGFSPPLEFAVSVMGTNAAQLAAFLETLPADRRAELTTALDNSAIRRLMETWSPEQKTTFAKIVGGDSPLVLDVLNAALPPKAPEPAAAAQSAEETLTLTKKQFDYVMDHLRKASAATGAAGPALDMPDMSVQQALMLECHSLAVATARLSASNEQQPAKRAKTMDQQPQTSTHSMLMDILQASRFNK